MVKVGDKIKVLRDYPAGTEEVAGTILKVTGLHENGIFSTTSTDPEVNGWVMGCGEFNEDYIEIVKEVVEPVKVETAGPKKGLRYNSDKLRWRNFPMFLMKPLIEVAQYGESKYATFNFLDGQTTLDSMDSLKRHLELFENPYKSDLDDESKVNHLAHVAWNALVALYMLENRPDLDDRWKGPGSK